MNVTDEPRDLRGEGIGPSRPWLSCVVPLAVYLIIGLAEPTAAAGGVAASLHLPLDAYPLLYALRLAATAIVVAIAWPHIRAWVGRPTWWPPLVGLALVVPWVVLAHLQRDAGWGGTGRTGFDPFAEFATEPLLLWGFFGLRFLGLVVLVPLVEELFVRGFFLRFVVKEAFWEVPFGTLTPAAAAACCLYAAASHPPEAVAAVGWFAILSGIAAATRKPIDCILAHAATNLALGSYVVATGNWWLL